MFDNYECNCTLTMSPQILPCWLGVYTERLLQNS
uniref:Uncharacterized protein n=1 Tax=Ciona intestinalis TaxID=7719 RepID=H2XNL2_CIOIN